jgi:hypothetical protein
VGIGTTQPIKALEVVSASGDAEIGVASGDPGGILWTIQSSNRTNTAGDFQIIDRTNGVGYLRITPGSNTVSVPILQITGADVAERFPMEHVAGPGTVLAIDPSEPGRLKICDEPMSRNVAGVVSGAGKLHAGVVLGGASEDGDGTPVALSGRVWVKADATERPIHVGDLLVTARRAGYACAARDESKAVGRILGKAMSNLKAGTGLVLVLVSLQ